MALPLETILNRDLFWKSGAVLLNPQGRAWFSWGPSSRWPGDMREGLSSKFSDGGDSWLWWRPAFFLKDPHEELWQFANSAKMLVTTEEGLLTAESLIASRAREHQAPQVAAGEEHLPADARANTSVESQWSGLSLWPWTVPNKNQFAEDFSSIQRNISSGHLTKVVPVVFETSPQRPSAADLLNLFIERWRRHFTQPQSLRGYLYGMWNEESGILGYTPELLLAKSQRENLGPKSPEQGRTIALAGTGPTTTCLLSDSKNRYEHDLVIDDIRETLLGIGVGLGAGVQGLITVSDTQEFFFGQCKHLRTPIEFSWPLGKTPLIVAKALHPTAALGGRPRMRALELLGSLPSATHRGTFGAPFGVINSEIAEIVVSIRCLQWDLSGSRIGAGCGVIAQSQFEQEWDELQLKRDSVKWPTPI